MRWWGNRPGWARWLAAVYVVGFLEGTGAHAYFLVAGGLDAYDYAPAPVRLLFHALLLLDPLAAVLIVRGRPAGPLVCGAVMFSDVVANWWVQWSDVLARPAAHLRPVGLLPITLFGVLVLATALPLRRVLTSTAVTDEDELRRTAPARSRSVR